MLLGTCILVPISLPFYWVYTKRKDSWALGHVYITFSSVSEYVVSQSGHVRLLSSPGCFSFLFANYPLSTCEHLVWSAFLIFVVLMNVPLYLMVLICISLMNSDSEHLSFVYWLFGYPSLFPVFCPFKKIDLIFKTWLVRILMYSKDKTFAYICNADNDYLFMFFFFDEQKFLILM